MTAPKTKFANGVNPFTGNRVDVEGLKIASDPYVGHRSRPVAWMIWLHGPVEIIEHKQFAELEFERLNQMHPNVARKLLPLYTAPQPRRRLTDEQIIEWVESGEYNVTTNDWASHIAFARAIEAAVWGDAR